VPDLRTPALVLVAVKGLLVRRQFRTLFTGMLDADSNKRPRHERDTVGTCLDTQTDIARRKPSTGTGCLHVQQFPNLPNDIIVFIQQEEDLTYST